jgi:hypothetical protein
MITPSDAFAFWALLPRAPSNAWLLEVFCFTLGFQTGRWGVQRETRCTLNSAAAAKLPRGSLMLHCGLRGMRTGHLRKKIKVP